MQSAKPENIDAYIASCPATARPKLQELRELIGRAAPEAEEKISYAIPTFHQQGDLVHFAGYASHIGFYPTPEGIEAFKEEAAPYESGKGTLQFPLDKPLPRSLITRIVKYRLAQNLAKGK